jgi:hypothetical protein
MDAWPALIASGLVAALGIVAVGAIADVADGQLTGLGSLLGGWRPHAWPSGVQEDDPEAGWARHSAFRRPDGDMSPSTGWTIGSAPDDPEADDGFLSWIEELD